MTAGAIAFGALAATGQPAAAQASSLCPSTHPYRVDPPGEAYDAFIVGCVNRDGSSVSTENRSNGVVRLWPQQATALLSFQAFDPPLSTDLVSLAVGLVTSGGWRQSFDGRGPWYFDLVPGGRVVISARYANVPVSMRLDFVAEQAPVTLAATWVANAVANRTTSRSEALVGQTVACATEAVEGLRLRSPLWEDYLREGLQGAVACGGLAKMLNEQRTRTTTAQLADDALRSVDDLKVGRRLFNVAIDDIIAAAVRYLWR